ncbi:hypothetical protein ACFL1F_01120 [Chlamydiota bacterium]
MKKAALTHETGNLRLDTSEKHLKLMSKRIINDLIKQIIRKNKKSYIDNAFYE